MEGAKGKGNGSGGVARKRMCIQGLDVSSVGGQVRVSEDQHDVCNGPFVLTVRTWPEGFRCLRTTVQLAGRFDIRGKPTIIIDIAGRVHN